ncbi:MAG: recombinase family protein [Candidatus Flexifilum sp.]
MNKIAKRLSSMGILTRHDELASKGKRFAKKRRSGMWGESTIREILMSEIYAGRHYYNRLNPKRAPGEARVRDQSEWIPIEVPAIISREMWEAAQRLRDENKKTATRNTQHPYLMRGRMRCTQCGRIVGCRTDLRFDTPRGQYVCNRGKMHYYHDDLKTPVCRGTIKSHIIDEAVWEAIKTVLQSPQVILDALQQEADEHASATAIIRDRLEIAEKQLANFIGQRERLLSLYLNGEFPKDLLDEKMVEIKRAIGQFETEITSLRDQLNRATPALADIENITRFCEQIQGEIEEFTFEDKQTIIELLNVTAMMTKDDSGIRLVLSGYFPEITTDAIDHTTTR